MCTCAVPCLRPAVGPGQRQPAVLPPAVAVLLDDSRHLHDKYAWCPPLPGGDPVAAILHRRSPRARTWHPAAHRTARGIAGTGVGLPFRSTRAMPSSTVLALPLTRSVSNGSRLYPWRSAPSLRCTRSSFAPANRMS
jgi:hypothetical protein